MLNTMRYSRLKCDIQYIYEEKLHLKENRGYSQNICRSILFTFIHNFKPYNIIFKLVPDSSNLPVEGRQFGGFGGLNPSAGGGCPLCDSSVYSYCSHKLLHDSCCCGDPYCKIN